MSAVINAAIELFIVVADGIAAEAVAAAARML